MSKTRVGFALTGSFCTFSKVFSVIERLAKSGYDITPILSYRSAQEDTRFYSKDTVWQTLERITGKSRRSMSSTRGQSFAPDTIQNA